MAVGTEVVEMVIGLTDKQLEALRVFVELQRELGAPPTTRELGERLGVSNQAALQHIEALIRKGRLRRQEPPPGQRGHLTRALRVVDASELGGSEPPAAPWPAPAPVAPEPEPEEQIAADPLDAVNAAMERMAAERDRDGLARLRSDLGQLRDEIDYLAASESDDEEEKRPPTPSQYTATIQGRSIRSVQARLRETFGEDLLGVEKIERPTSRPARLAKAEGYIETAKEIVSELREEMENWRDGMPENLQDSAKGEDVSACAEALEAIADSLDGVDFSDVSFPGMFG